MSLHFRHERRERIKEHAAVPQEVARIDEFFCSWEVGFFGEFVDLHYIAAGLAAFDIAKPGFGSVGSDSYSHECAMIFGCFHGPLGG